MAGEGVGVVEKMGVGDKNCLLVGLQTNEIRPRRSGRVPLDPSVPF